MDADLRDLDAMLARELQEASSSRGAARNGNTKPLVSRSPELPSSSSRIDATRSTTSITPTRHIHALEAELASARRELALRARVTVDDVALLDLELEKTYSKELEAKLKVSLLLLAFD